MASPTLEWGGSSGRGFDAGIDGLPRAAGASVDIPGRDSGEGSPSGGVGKARDSVARARSEVAGSLGGVERSLPVEPADQGRVSEAEHSTDRQRGESSAGDRGRVAESGRDELIWKRRRKESLDAPGKEVSSSVPEADSAIKKAAAAQGAAQLEFEQVCSRSEHVQEISRKVDFISAIESTFRRR